MTDFVRANITTDNEPEPATTPRVVVKFGPNVLQPYSPDAVRNIPDAARRLWESLLLRFPSLVLEPYFTVDVQILSKIDEAAPHGAMTGLQSYYSVSGLKQVDANDIVKELLTWSIVEVAYAELVPQRDRLQPTQTRGSQGYLEAAPEGIDARYAWTLATGQGVGFVDLEEGWVLEHVDLVDAHVSEISGENCQHFGHGTAVLGIVVATHNKEYGRGIAPHACARVVSAWRSLSRHSVADAIVSGVSVMSPGDVLLLEMQNLLDLPIEVENVPLGLGVVYRAIRAASNRGIMVIEAAGNGRQNLDTLLDAGRQPSLNRDDRSFLDSGALVVGAASRGVPHVRNVIIASNFGTRVDCYAWGSDIYTCGNGRSGRGLRDWTPSFGGTSGAAAIVAGAAVLVQSLCQELGRRRLEPSELRKLLSDPNLNTESDNPLSDLVGVMPDLRKIYDYLRA